MGRLLLLFILTLAGMTPLSGQTFTGVVTDDAGHPLSAVSVILLDQQYKAVNYGRSGDDGRFAVTTKGARQTGFLVFNAMGYERDTISVVQFENGQKVVLANKPFEIREVTVRSDRITAHGDTLNYRVDGFRQKQDRSIADVISKMPGLEVKNDGTIEFEGKAINKFYVEGMDLMGSKYAQTSENLDASKVKTVQVLQNHQPVKALKDVNFSEQAALNLVLTDDAKNVWQGLTDIGLGHTLQGDAEVLGDNRLMAMLFARRMQSVSMFKQNNTGKDIAREVGDIGELLDYVPTETGVLSNISLPAPGLNASRTKFNQSEVFATNWLFKTHRSHDLRLQMGGKLDMKHEHQYSETQYTDLASGATVIEEASARSHANQVDGEVQYKANTDHYFLANTLKGFLGYDYSHGTSLLNGSCTREHVRPHRRYATDQLRFIKNMNGGHSLQASGYLSLNHLPGQLLLTDESCQRLTLSSFLYGASAGWSHAMGKSHLTYTLSHDGQSSRYRLSNCLSVGRDRYSQNRTKAAAAWAYKDVHWRINATLPLSVLARSFNDQSKTSWIVEPQVLAIYEPMARWQAMAVYNFAWSPLSMSQTSLLPVFTDYINLQQGTGQLDDTRAHVLMTNLQYKNTAQGIFAKVGLTQSHLLHSPLYESTLWAGGIYSRKATGQHADGHIYTIDGRVSRRFTWAGLNVSLSGSYSWNNHHLLRQNQLMPMQLRTSQTTFRLAAAPLAWFSLEATSSWTYSMQMVRHTDEYSDGLHTFDHRLCLYFMPGHWQIECNTDLFHSSDSSVSLTTFSDLRITYRTKRYEAGLILNNLAGKSEWQRRVITTTQTTYSVNTLRPREVLARLMLNL